MILGGSFSKSLQAQNTTIVDLQEAVKMALDNNLEVKSFDWSVKEQKLLKGAAWDVPKTFFEGQYGKFNSYTKDNSLTISQTIGPIRLSYSFDVRYSIIY